MVGCNSYQTEELHQNVTNLAGSAKAQREFGVRRKKEREWNANHGLDCLEDTAVVGLQHVNYYYQLNLCYCQDYVQEKKNGRILRAPLLTGTLVLFRGFILFAWNRVVQTF